MTEACPNETDGVTNAALSRAAQAAWEAPVLRSTFTPDGDVETWAHPCPDWCSGEGEGHDTYRIASGQGRQHQSHELRVRQDGAHGYVDAEGRDEGVRAAHLEVSLIAGSRSPDDPRVRMVARYGRRVSGTMTETQFGITGLYPDEVRELIAVLQHLLKVAGA